MDYYGAFIDRWRLIDGPLKGAKFTWFIFQQNSILCRLNRFLFVESGRICSQIVLSLCCPKRYRITPLFFGGICRPVGGPCSFKFEEMWFLEPDFIDVVSNEWNPVTFSSNLSKKFALKCERWSRG